MLAGNLFVSGEHGLRAAQVDNPAALSRRWGYAGNDFANAVAIFLVDNFLLGIAHALNDDLLGGLGRNPAQIGNLDAKTDFVIQLDGRVVLARVGQGYLGLLIGHVPSSTTILNW